MCIRDSHTEATSRHAVLDVRGLGKHVPLPGGDLTILDDIGFRIEHGDTVAIVGASGSGKSTLLSLLAGLDVPSAGAVTLDGERLSDLDEDGRARVRGEKVGFVFQSFQLLPSLTALENVMLPLELRGDADVEEMCIRDRRMATLDEERSVALDAAVAEVDQLLASSNALLRLARVQSQPPVDEDPLVVLDLSLIHI